MDISQTIRETQLATKDFRAIALNGKTNAAVAINQTREHPESNAIKSCDQI